MTDHSFVTEGGVDVARRETPADYATAIETLIDRLDDHCGVLLSSRTFLREVWPLLSSMQDLVTPRRSAM